MMKNVTVSLFLVALPMIDTCSGAEYPGDLPGTYEMVVCNGRCSFEDPANIVVKGILVLLPVAYKPEALNSLSPKPFEYGYSFGPDSTNGCFVLETLVKHKTWAGLMDLGMTSWSFHAKRLTFSLYASPDAEYFVTAQFGQGGFDGQGVSSGGGPAEPHHTADAVLGRRIGPAELSRCIAGAWDHEKRSRRPV
jgi:hypothetical protein